MLKMTLKDSIMILELGKAPANALDISYLKELYKALWQIDKDQRVTGVILKSKYKTCFSSGLDLTKLTLDSSVKQKMNLFSAVWLVYRIVCLIVKSEKIYMASVSGAVIGSAVSIVLACDFRFATPEAWFWLPDPLYGGLLADGGIDLIKKCVGTAGAKNLCLTNVRLNAEEALRLGILNDMKDDNSLEDYINRFAIRLSGYSLKTLQNTKALINKNLLDPFPFINLLQVICSKEMADRIKKYIQMKGK